MKRADMLQHIFVLADLIVLLAGCTSSSTQGTQASPSAQGTRSATPSLPITQLKPEAPIPSMCPTTPIYRGGKQNVFVTSEIPWVQAQPTSSGIVGHLFYAPYTLAEKGSYRFLHTGGVYPTDGTNTKILWTIDHPNILATVQIAGTNLSSPGKTFHQDIDPTSSPIVVSPPSQYPSIIVVPNAGCWRLQVSSGQASGTIIMWVVG